MKVPSRMVVMENLPPQRPNGSQVETVDVRYIGNSVIISATCVFRSWPIVITGKHLFRYSGHVRL